VQSTEQRIPSRTLLFLFVAVVCSLILTYLTITPPLIPTDWARLNANGVYVPVQLDYAWPSYGVQVGLWVVMIVASYQLSVVSKREKQRQRKDFHHSPTGRLRTGTEDTEKTYGVIWMVMGITLVGFGLRVHGFDRLPLIIDEIGFAAHASDILHGQQVPIFAPGHNANPSVYSWLLAGVMAVLGQNTFAIRLLPLLFGTLSIPAMYVLGREWCSQRVGVLAAIFLAMYPAHIFYSRMSLYNIVDPFFAMLALAFLARGVRFPKERQYWILAGLMTGIAQYFYHGSRLVLVLMAVYLGLSAVSYQRSAKDMVFTTEAQRKFPKQMWARDVLWMVFIFVVVALPRFAPMLVNRLPLTGNEQGLHLPADLAANSLRAVMAWAGQKDVSPFWLSDAPLLEWPVLLAFGLGGLICLWRWRDARSAVLLSSIVLTTILGGAIWTAAPLYVRYMTAVPAIGLLVAVGIEKIKSVSQRSRGTEKQRENTGRQYGVLQIVVIGLIVVQGVYAAMQQTDEAVGRITASQWMEQDLAQQAANLPVGTGAVMVVPDDFNEVQRITLAHYVAASGERRAVVVNQDEEKTLPEQVKIIDFPYTILKPYLNEAVR
jgi:hypothetical protein